MKLCKSGKIQLHRVVPADEPPVLVFTDLKLKQFSFGAVLAGSQYKTLERFVGMWLTENRKSCGHHYRPTPGHSEMK